ncbi:MAG: D-glycero-beta-D-manno-heptose 1-phosphate adenylyltransferase [Candidatus Omnitrophica bacterium]|nr:D-glycero-beta-D-manno-heptose 1-phosphate adenylyltransferase [Candidatus Omnitrophota bacterium]
MRTGRTGAVLEAKIKSLKPLRKITASLRSRGKKIVFTNGCFDLLHYGHVKYLQDAKAKGDILVVAINTDASVKKIKGPKRPIVGEKDRAKVIAALASVDYVTLFNEDTPLKTIRALKPDILVKGADWNKKAIVGSDLVSGYGGKVATINFIKGRSTTNLINKIAQNL